MMGLTPKQRRLTSKQRREAQLDNALFDLLMREETPGSDLDDLILTMMAALGVMVAAADVVVPLREDVLARVLERGMVS